MCINDYQVDDTVHMGSCINTYIFVLENEPLFYIGEIAFFVANQIGKRTVTLSSVGCLCV